MVLPPRLDALLAALTSVSHEAVVIRGWSRECGTGEHSFARWKSGLYRPPTSATVLSLALYVCTLCETVEVRDRTLDILHGPSGVAAQGRRDGLLGWYSGPRSRGRTYH